ncbi:MAG: hypothetical protein DCE90_18855 [Pseudanabaena sp.]|nr:MAG: hypothetical protein DCE90_18855 [Pseudanabaena sp.]
MTKKIGKASITGQKGINLIEKIVLDMGFVWHPTNLDAGIDGYIEIRDSVSEEVTNLIIQVQSKATEKLLFKSEDTNFCEFTCDKRDLEYWMHGNAPVILIYLTVSTNEAYWISIKDYFKDFEKHKDRKVKFQRTLDKFDASCKEALINLAKPNSYGLYIAPPPVKEILYSNLLEVVNFPKKLFVAAAKYSDYKKTMSTLKLFKSQLPNEWIFTDKSILSFHNLKDDIWNRICEVGSVDTFDTTEWAYADCEDKRKVFVWLLNKCLAEKVKNDLDYWKEKNPHYYYFRHTPDLSTRTIRYQSIQKTTTRQVFRSYKKKNTDGSYYRHSGFQGHFLLLNDRWYLEINPTYHFTNDGKQKSKFSGGYLSGIKNLEGNASVLGQVVMWADFLRGVKTSQLEIEVQLLSEYEFLRFGELMKFEIDVGIDDKLWRPQNIETSTDDEVDDDQSMNDLPLFGQEIHEN